MNGRSVSGAEGVRQRNLARVLRLVHVDGPLERSRLTAETSLNRSTIADLVAELVGRGLVQERSPDRSRRVGRPSAIVSASSQIVAIAVNPEVDALTIAAVALDRSILTRERIEMDRLITPDETSSIVAARLAEWRTGVLTESRLVGAGLAIPGLVRAKDGLVRIAPHLEWSDVPIGALVAESTGLPTVVGNDAALGAIAEHLFGAGRGIDDIVYLNGGASGIGGGLIVHGMPVEGAGGYAGEFGQNRPGIAAEGDRRAAHGTLEDEVSRARLLAAVGLSSADEPTLASALDGSRTRVVVDEVARQRRILATALANAVNVLNPSIVILGGFLATLAELDPTGLDAAVREQSMSSNAEGLAIRGAALAEDRLLIGAAEAAFADLLTNPLTF